jgi:hypothetical protein
MRLNVSQQVCAFISSRDRDVMRQLIHGLMDTVHIPISPKNVNTTLPVGPILE